MESIVTNSTGERDVERRERAQRLLDQYQVNQYFDNVKPALWSAYSFIFEIPRILLTRPDAKSFLTDAWVRGLRRARDDDDMPERRKIAERLLNRYEINVRSSFMYSSL